MASIETSPSKQAEKKDEKSTVELQINLKSILLPVAVHIIINRWILVITGLVFNVLKPLISLRWCSFMSWSIDNYFLFIPGCSHGWHNISHAVFCPWVRFTNGGMDFLLLDLRKEWVDWFRCGKVCLWRRHKIWNKDDRIKLLMSAFNKLSRHCIW